MIVLLLLTISVAITFAEEHTSTTTKAPISYEEYTYPGKCPEYFKPADGFDIQKFSKGRWFSYSYHGKQREWLNHKYCPEVQFYYFPESQPQHHVFEYYFVNASGPYWQNFTREYNPDKPGYFPYPQEASAKAGPHEFWYKTAKAVVDTDYENYSAIWGCYDVPDHDRHYESIVVYSRTRGYLAPEYSNKVKAYFERHPVVEFHPINWSDCRVHCHKPE